MKQRSFELYLKKKKPHAALPTCVIFFSLFQAWELLVLSKLGWNLDTVTACDYLLPLAALLASGPEEEEEEDAKSSLVSNGELVRKEHFGGKERGRDSCRYCQEMGWGWGWKSVSCQTQAPLSSPPIIA